MKDRRETADFSIAKTENDKMFVFGWANVAIRKDGTQVEDLQGDIIDPDELEKAAYDHVLKFRSAGERHDPNLRSKGRLIESCVFTKEKQAAMGIPPGVLDEAWWVGYKIDDPAAWAKIKSGDYKMFSVEGKGKREAIAKSYGEAKEAVEKFNPYHGRDGRFTSANAAASFTYAPGKSAAHNKAIEREKKRHEEEQPKRAAGKNAEPKPSRKEKAAQKTRDWIKNQIDVDIDKYRNDTTRRFDNTKLTNVDWSSMPKTERRRIEELASRYGGSLKLHNNGAWMKAIQRIEKSSEIPEKSVQRVEFLKQDGSIIEFEKFNPYHDQLGRFSTGNAFVTFSPGSNPTQAKRSIDRENERRRKEGIEGEVGGKFVNVGTTGGKAGYHPIPYDEAKRLAAEHGKEAERKEPPKSEFKPAKTKKEAVEYAQKELGFQTVSYGTKLDIDTINHINEQISSIQAKYPETIGAVQVLKTTTKQRTYAQIRTRSDGSMNLEIASTQYRQGLSVLEKSYKIDVDGGYHPAGTTANSIIWHEYGHILAAQATMKQMGIKTAAIFDAEQQREFINQRRNVKIESEWLSKAAQNMNISGKTLSATISDYSKENPGEAFAEAFAEVNCAKSPRKEALELVKASGYYRK